MIIEPKIFSVVTPVFNSERFLDETIQSVITQRGNFFINYVLIDNCSTDKTLEIINKYQDDVRSERFNCNCLGVTLRYLTEPDQGMYDALIKGMELCSGDFFAYINSDDFYLPNAFATVYKVFENPEVDWVTGLPTFYNKYGSVVAANIPCIYKSKYISSGVYGKQLTHIQQESTFWRSVLCDDLDFSDLARYKYAGDYYMWSVFSKKYMLHTVKAQLSGFRFHDNNKSSNVAAYNKEFDTIAINVLNLFDYIKIYSFKILFKLFGNKLLRFFSSVIVTR